MGEMSGAGNLLNGDQKLIYSYSKGNQGGRLHSSHCWLPNASAAVGRTTVKAHKLNLLTKILTNNKRWRCEEELLKTSSSQNLIKSVSVRWSCPCDQQRETNYVAKKL